MKSHITAVFDVRAGTNADVMLHVAGMSPDEIAERVERAAQPYVSVCHQCAHNIIDPEVGDLVSFTVGNVDYVQQDGKWVRA